MGPAPSSISPDRRRAWTIKEEGSTGQSSGSECESLSWRCRLGAGGISSAASVCPRSRPSTVLITAPLVRSFARFVCSRSLSLMAEFLPLSAWGNGGVMLHVYDTVYGSTSGGSCVGTWFVSLCLGQCHSYPLSFSFTLPWLARSIPWAWNVRRRAWSKAWS